MYVFLESVSNLNIPYSVKNAVRTLHKAHMFVPGKNYIHDDLWDIIVDQNQNEFESHYSKFLFPFQTKFDTGQKPELRDYTEEEMLEIVDQAKTRAFLEHLHLLEIERRFDFKARQSVVDAIKRKMPPPEYDLDELKKRGENILNYVVSDEEDIRRRERLYGEREG